MLMRPLRLRLACVLWSVCCARLACAQDEALPTNTTANITGISIEEIEALGPGRCAQKVGNTYPHAACSQQRDAVSCLTGESSQHCEWKLQENQLNYTCYCTFAECKCGDPAEDARESYVASADTMFMIAVPIAISLSFVCISYFGWLMRERFAWLFKKMLPDIILNKVGLPVLGPVCVCVCARARACALSVVLARWPSPP